MRKYKREVFHCWPKSPSYSRQFIYSHQCQASVKLSGSFCPCVGRPHLHSHFNFIGQWFKTVFNSLSLSCRPELTRQGATLPSNNYSYCCRSPGLMLEAFDLLLWPTGTGQASTTILHLTVLAVICVFVKQSPEPFSWPLNSRAARENPNFQSKSEIRISKLEINLNDKNSNVWNIRKFGFWKLFRISRFWISNLVVYFEFPGATHKVGPSFP